MSAKLELPQYYRLPCLGVSTKTKGVFLKTVVCVFLSVWVEARKNREREVQKKMLDTESEQK